MIQQLPTAVQVAAAALNLRVEAHPFYVFPTQSHLLPVTHIVLATAAAGRREALFLVGVLTPIGRMFVPMYGYEYLIAVDAQTYERCLMI